MSEVRKIAVLRPDAGDEPASGVTVSDSSRLASRATQREVDVGALYATILDDEVDAADLDEVRGPGVPSLDKARAGDPAELEKLARRELPRVERLLRRLLGHRSDLEDLVQTVFLEMCRALPGFRGQSSFSTFVGGITVRVAKRAMRPPAWIRFRGPMPETPPASPDRPYANALATEQLRRLRAVLTRIAPDKRIAFLLWAVEGMDVDAIAAVTGASVSATRSRIYYAQKELKALAAQDPYLCYLLEGEHAR